MAISIQFVVLVILTETGGAVEWNSVEEGGDCTYFKDCIGWADPVNGLYCCPIVDDCPYYPDTDKICMHRPKDWANVNYCPHECKGCSGCSVGTCPLMEEGQCCREHADCIGSKVSCCGGTCRRTKKDYAGICWCPNQCKKEWWSSQGSCPNSRLCYGMSPPEPAIDINIWSILSLDVIVSLLIFVIMFSGVYWCCIRKEMRRKYKMISVEDDDEDTEHDDAQEY
eukprot:112886_1